MFRDREDAARQLAALLRGHALEEPLVLAIPRGGMVTGAVLAQELGAELDVILSRKLRAPHQRELAIGALSESGNVFVIDDDLEAAGIPDEYFHREKAMQQAALDHWKQRARRVRPAARIAGRTVIIADDGAATGSTLIAALQTARAQHPAELIAAVPVAPADRIHDLELHCDRLVCPLRVAHLVSVGQFYENYPTVADEQVLHMLREFAPQAT